MTTLADMQRQLQEHERGLLQLADEISQMVPANCDPGALILTARNRTAWAASECKRAYRDFTLAIQETGGE